MKSLRRTTTIASDWMWLFYSTKRIDGDGGNEEKRKDSNNNNNTVIIRRWYILVYFVSGAKHLKMRQGFFRWLG